MNLVKRKILIVYAEQPIRKLLDSNLREAWYETISAAEGKAAIEMAENEKPDLILLDLMLPIIDGMEVCKILRKRAINIPIIMLTAKGDDRGRLVAIEGMSDVPFAMSRVYHVYATTEATVPGKTSHHALNKLAVAFAGHSTL